MAGIEKQEDGEEGTMSAYVKDYPRPQFVRDSWQGLNGEWKFRFDDGNLSLIHI